MQFFLVIAQSCKSFSIVLIFHSHYIQNMETKYQTELLLYKLGINSLLIQYILDLYT